MSLFRNLNKLILSLLLCIAVTAMASDPFSGPPGVEIRVTEGTTGTPAFYLVFPSTYFGLDCATGNPAECALSLANAVSLLGGTLGDVSGEFNSGSGDATGNCAPGVIYVNESTSLGVGAPRTGRWWFCSHTNTWSRFGDITSSGVSGGQTVLGGTAADDNLTLESTSNSDSGYIDIAPDFTYNESNDYIVQIAPTTSISTSQGKLSLIHMSPTITGTGTLGQTIRGILFDGSLTASSGAPLEGTQLFTAIPTIQSSGAIAVPPGQTFIDQTIFKCNNAACGTQNVPVSALYIDPDFLSSGGSGAYTLTNFRAIDILGAVLTDTTGGTSTITNWTGMYVRNPSFGSGAGTEAITSLRAIDIEDLTRGGTNNVSIRSQGTAVEMRHAGPVAIGQSTAVDSNAILEVESTSKGLKFPRLAYSAMSVISCTGNLGLVVYCTDCNNSCSGTTTTNEGYYCGCQNNDSPGWARF